MEQNQTYRRRRQRDKSPVGPTEETGQPSPRHEPTQDDLERYRERLRQAQERHESAGHHGPLFLPPSRP